MSELKPCPFCGGEARTTQKAFDMYGGWSVECVGVECGCDFAIYGTEVEAIEAWNTRSERTCEDVSENPLRFECSACGGVSLDIVPNYCPCCGVKVVEP